MGCQTYTWQMSYAAYKSRMDHILRIIAQSGLGGVEPEVCMLGKFIDPAALARELDKNRLHLAAICYVADWMYPKETPEERAQADQAIALTKHFKGTLLALCQMPGKDRTNLQERQANAVACVNAASRRAMDQGVACAFHPNSPPGSVFRTEEDYEILLTGLDRTVVGFAPDVGHIANGGMDAGQIIKRYRPFIRHVHFKDISPEGQWIELGRGVIDFPGIVANLKTTGYQGWIMVEDESPLAETDPDRATLRNGQYTKDQLLPLC